jgi:integrase/recombinase XerC
VLFKHLLGQLSTTSKKTSASAASQFLPPNWSNNGADLNAIKELLGHSSLAATQVIHASIPFEKLKGRFIAKRIPKHKGL